MNKKTDRKPESLLPVQMYKRESV